MSKTIGAMFVVVAAAFVFSGSRPAAGTTPAAAPLDFLQQGHCYRIAFSIEGAPNYKVLELLEGGWIKAEVDAGSAKAQRQSLWINTAQIVTVREVRCSE